MNSRKTPNRPIIGATMAAVGLMILMLGSYYMMFKNPRSNVEDLFGLAMWILGSSLLGGGITLMFARGWIAFLIAFLSPGVTFGILVALYWGFFILNAILALQI